jgi:hypothetical protein
VEKASRNNSGVKEIDFKAEGQSKSVVDLGDPSRVKSMELEKYNSLKDKDDDDEEE